MQTYQVLTNDDEARIPSFFRTLLAVPAVYKPELETTSPQYSSALTPWICHYTRLMFKIWYILFKVVLSFNKSVKCTLDNSK